MEQLWLVLVLVALPTQRGIGTSASVAPALALCWLPWTKVCAGTSLFVKDLVSRLITQCSSAPWLIPEAGAAGEA